MVKAPLHSFLGFSCIIFWLSITGLVLAAAYPTDGDVRLVDGGANSQGRIEIYLNDTWWAICENHFSWKAFEVVCNMISLPYPHERYHNSEFGRGNQSILPMDFSCDGDESSLLECRHEDYNEHHCGDEVVGVSCGELVLADCEGGGTRTDITGQLNFLRGPGPHERECEWIIENDDDSSNIIVSGFRNSEECGNHLSIKDDINYHEYFSGDLCGDGRSILVEIPSRRVVVRVEQHYQHVDVGFEGAYTIVKGDLGSAPQIGGWDLTSVNVSTDSFHIQWPILTNQISEAVRVYMVVVTLPHDGREAGRIVSSNTSSVGFYGLYPGKEYGVTVLAMDESGDLHKSSQTITTEEDVPSSHPSYRGYDILGDGCLLVKWEPISEYDRNGQILYYTITYVPNCYGRQDSGNDENVTVSGSSNNVTLCNLHPGWEYRLGLSGSTAKGMGPTAYHDDVFAGCGKERTLTNMTGIIESPNQPCGYGGEQECLWSINPNASFPKAIWVEFTEFRLAQHNDEGCSFNDMIGFSTADSISDTLLCGRLDKSRVLVSDRHVQIEFSARFRWREDGFIASYQGVTNDVTVTKLSSWNVSVVPGIVSAEVTWADFPGNASIGKLFLTYTHTNENITILLPIDSVGDRSYDMDNLLVPNSEYTFEVYAFTGGIEDDIYSSASVTVTTKEGAPTEAPPNVRVEILKNNEILVFWDPLPEQYANGEIRLYVVYLREWRHHYQWSDDDQLARVVNVSLSDNQLLLSDFDGGRVYQVAVAAFTIDYGPRSEWEKFQVGCDHDGSFSEYFGAFDLRQWGWEERLDCSWTIHNPGLSNPVVYFSVYDLDFRNCEGWARIYDDDGSEVKDFEKGEHCRNYIRGEILEVPFGDAYSLTFKLHTEHEGSRMISEFVILEDGKELDSAQTPVPPWYITTNSSHDGRVQVNLSTHPDDDDVAFFITSFTMIESDQHDDHHHQHEEDDDKPMEYLHMENASQTLAKVPNLPVFTNFTLTAYLVDVTNDIYRSEDIIIETPEGVPSEGPHVDDYKINEDGCVELDWHPISEEQLNGRILGYIVTWETSCFSEHDPHFHYGSVNVSAPNTTATVCDLRPGLEYGFGLAGFTSAGAGEVHHRDGIFTGCGDMVTLTDEVGEVKSPNRPCNYGGEQHCFWSIKPNTSFPTKEIWIYFEDFSRLEVYEESSGCRANDWIGFSTNGNVTDALICRDMGEFFVVISGSHVDLSFIARGEHYRRGEGFSASYAGIESELNVTHLSSWNLSVSTGKISADAQWTAFPLNEHVENLWLRFKDVDGDVSVLIPVDENGDSYHIHNLLKTSTNYIFDLVAFTGDFGKSQGFSSHNVTVATLEGAPEIAPDNVNLQLLPGNRMLVTWDPLPGEFTNGQLFGYIIYLRFYKHEYEWYDDGEFGRSVNVSSSETRVILDDLDGGRRYQVSVAAFTVDVGPKSNWMTFMVGCGGSFYGHFGEFNVTQWDWEELYCSWTIHNPGLSDPVLLIAAHDVQLRSCNGWAKVFSSDDSEVFHHGGCSSVHGEIEEVPFDGSSVLTLKLHMRHEWSYVRSEFVILEREEKLFSALPTSPTPWYLSANTNQEGKVVVDLSGSPSGIDDNFFIISMNETKGNDDDHHHHGDDDADNGGRYLFMFNSSNSLFAELSAAPVFRNFTTIVYIVDKSDKIFRSEEFLVQTPEGAPDGEPHMEDLAIDTDGCVKIKWYEISEEDRNGLILGYKIYYRTSCFPEDDPGHVDVMAPSTEYKLCNIPAGRQYQIGVAGFTKGGSGPSSERDVFTACEGLSILTEVNGTIESPNKPCQYGGKQQCHWSIQPNHTTPIQAIWVYFGDFRLEEYEDSDCWSNDWVGISKGESGAASLMCGHGPDFFALIKSSEAFISFNARGEHHRRGDGFYAWYQAVDEEVTVTKLPQWNCSVSVDSLSVDYYWTAFPLGESDTKFAVRFTQDNVSVMVSVEEHDRSYRIDKALLPYRDYVMDVVAFAQDKIYSSESTSIKTPEGAPGKAPPNVRVQSLKDNSILVMWDPLPEKYANGELQGYVIFTRPYKREYKWHDDGELGQILNVSLSETHVILSGLDGGRRYQISVAAVTVDVGPRSEWKTIMVGCGGSFYGFFGAFNLTQWDYEARLDCSWTISNAGLSNAVLLISAHEVELRSCEGWVRVFTAEGNEVFHFGGCDPHEYVHGELVEVPFDGSSYLTLVLHTESEESHVRSEFCVLQEDTSLSSAQPSASPWNVKANSTDDGDILVDLASDPDGQDASQFYIISLNKTGGSQHEYGHHDDDDSPPRYLHMANSSEGITEVSGLPVYSEFNAVVYRVDNSHDIFSSEIFTVQTAEGVPSEGPGHVEYKIVSPDSVYIEWSEISEEHHNGELLGFYISYRAQCSDDEGWSTNVDLFDRSYTITSLHPGTRYDIWIAGFTGRGVGEHRHMDVAMPCGGLRKLTEINGTMYAPNYPCRYRGPQYCRWSIEPSGSTTAIMMSFENIRLDRNHDSYCSTNDWLGIATGKYNNDTLLCGHGMDRFTLLISGSRVELAFFAREHREGEAFFASYYGLETSVQEIEVSSWTLSVDNIESTKAEVSWEEFPRNDVPDVHIEQMYLKISEANKNISLLLPVSEWDRSRHIESLYPDREYLLQVVAFTGPGVEHDIYSSDSVFMKTKEGAPSMAPTNVRVDNYHQYSIIVRFEPLPASQHGGDLVGYNVYYKREEDRHDHDYQGEKVTIGPSETQAVIHGLEIMEEYYVWVSAFNSEEGPLSYPQSIVVGCGGMFNQTAALIKISKSDWDTRHCVWKIHDNGLENAVLLMSVHVLHYESCGHEYAKVYSEENYFLSYQDCSEVRGEVFELPFGNSRVIISEILIQNINSYMETELIILKGGLHSAQPSSDLWNISVYSAGDSGIALDWYGYPSDLEIAFFILSVNQTTLSPYYDDHDDDDRKLLRILRTFNSSESTFIMEDLSSASEFAAIVYIIDKNNEIIKSMRRIFNTEEGVPTEGPHLHDWSTNTAERSASFQISPLEERHHGGRLLGYIIKYAALGGPNNTDVMLEVDEDTRRVNLVNLTEGPTYVLAIAGFTSKGEGKQRIYAITFCGRQIEELATEIRSPNYPNTPYIAPDQYDENPQCYWNMRPADPSVSAIWITFEDFLIGRREDWGGCSGGVKFYFPDQSEHDDSTGLQLCGRIENLTLLITDNVLNLKAWGFGYHRYDHEYREGTRFLFDYKAVTGDLTTVIGEDIDSWSLGQMTVTNVSITLSWPSPPAIFLSSSAVETYLIIYGWPNRRLFGTLWLPAQQQNATIDWLDPLTNYTIKVTAILEDGKRGSIRWKDFRTTEGVPSQNPYIYWYSVVDYSTIWIRWHRIEDRAIRGTLLGYRVHILEAEYHHGSQPYKKEMTINDPDQFDFNITGLPPATRFRIWVAAFTAIGEGTHRHEQWIKTKCGSPLYDREGAILSLGYPDRLEYGDCEWDIHSKNKSVLLFFEHLDIPNSHECKEFYVAVGDDSGVPPKLLCGEIDQFFVLVQAHKVLVLSHAERDIHGGEGFKVFYSTLNQSVWEAELLTSWVINTSNVGVATVDAAWPHYSSGVNEELFLYAVVCTPTLGEHGPTILTLEPGVNSSNVERLRPYTEYTAQVIALVKSDPGEQISFKGSMEANFTTEEGVPSKPPGDVKTTTAVSVIRVTWLHIPSDGVNGVLSGYKVFYRLSDDRGDEDNDAQYSEITVGPTVLVAHIEGVTNSENYEIRVAGFTKAGVGVFSEAIYARPGCENTVTEKMLLLSSPGFPKDYPSNTECYWVFEQNWLQFDVVVAIDTFHMETPDGGPNCTNWVTDFLGLFNIDPLHVAAGPVCGLHPDPFALVGRGSRNHRAVLYMRTNDGFEYQGFNATYFAVTDTSNIDITSFEIQNHEMRITWQVFNNAENIEEFFVLYKPVAEKEIWSFKKSKNQEVTLLPLQPGTKYMVRIVGYSASQQVYASEVASFETLAELETTPRGFSPTTEPIPRMYSYGTEYGDSVITFNSKCHGVSISIYGGIPFYSKRHRKLYICPTGTIQFERSGINQGPYRFGERPWLRYSPMLAPYWAPTDLRSFVDGPSKVFYQVYQGPDSNAMLQKATEDVLSVFSSQLPQGKTFSASFVLVVTWQDIRHQLQNDITKNLRNTFQAVVVTDAIFSFVIFNYPHGGIEYSAPTTPQHFEYFGAYQRNPVVGVNAGERTGYYENHPRSWTTGIEAIDNLVGNVNIPGRWVYRLEDSDGEEDGDLKCEQWLRNDTETQPSSYSEPPDPCPCTGIQAFFDERYEWVEPDYPFTYCFYTRFASSDGRGRKCCYYTSQEKFAALVIGFPGGGTLDRYHKLTPSLQAKHAESDVRPFQYCCKEAQNPSWCVRYFERRPSEGCEEYEPPEWSWLWGDPHIVTLDTGNYTFNGLGEFTMVDVKDGMFQLQARTKLAKGEGTATVFVAAVAKEEDTSTVQVSLKDEGGLEVLVDSEVFQNYSSLTNVSVMLSGSVAVSRPENNSFLVTFPSGISVTVTEIQGSLSIVFAAPTKFKTYTKGLLGTWNGDILDDYLRPDGTTLPSNATGREIHFDFGLKWQVMSNTSLFTYNPGENITTFVNASFVPIFLDEPIPFANDALRQKAEEICQGDANCLFDIASTGDTAVGASTKQTAVQLESESQELQNFPPKILVGPSEVNVTINTTAVITVVAEDPNNDSLTFSVTGTLPTGYTKSSNDSSITIAWSVTITKIDIEFIITDGSVNTVLRPVINVCTCQNEGICTSVEEENDVNDDDSSSDRFNILSCVCQNGYTGDLCETDLDACEENFEPCYPGVTCNDLPPPANETGFQCDPCPSGYSGDGIQCLDDDECTLDTDGCDQNCINTPGTFVCKCNSGFFLDLDQKTCQDVDECSPVSDCMHICDNTVGGYTCKCNSDFKVDDTDPKKCVPENPCHLDQHGCDHICYQSDGEDKCSCRAGYKLNDDGKTCSDIDECTTDQNRCDQSCSDTEGSYTCSCVAGFTLDGDGFTCNDVDECLAWTFDCEDDSQMCENTYGSYKCACAEGLYWIDGQCKGLEKGEEPPPPPAAAPPRTPSEEERSQSVNLDVQGLNITEWNQPLEENFKTTLAESATAHCAENDCRSEETSSRRRRAANYVTFTEDQVHLLPGYPKQASTVPLLASVAFYLQFPPGSSSAVIQKDVLTSIVKGSLTKISSAINANITSVEVLIADRTTSATTVYKTYPTEKEASKTMYYIIGGCVAGAVALIIIILVAVWCCKAKNGMAKPRVDSELSIEDKGGKMEMDVVNYGYHTETTHHV